MLQRWRYQRRCRNLSRQSTAPALSEYLLQSSRFKADHIENTPIIVADLELTGLKSKQNEIIAIGWTVINNGRIQMGSNRHLLVKADQTVGSSAAIHELMDSEVAQGVDLAHGLEALFEAAQGRVWVFHHAGLDVSFLKKACEDWGGVVPGFHVLDTMSIEHRLRRRRDLPVKQGDLHLGTLRREYGLPQYTAHNALIDALATAELLLAIAARLGQDEPFALDPHIKYF